MADSGPVTTAGVIAVANLEARIDGHVSRTMSRRLSVGEWAELGEELLPLEVLACKQCRKVEMRVPEKG